MCGITGFASPDLARTPKLDLVAQMVRELSHRGPDDEGILTLPGVALGHRRLAVLDLSHAGHQPFLSPDGRYSLVYNGEIYNYRELQQQLRADWHFETQCDTEVLMAAWCAWGTDCLRRVRGMFAFGIWDAVERELHLARDRFGIKPLYYYESGNGLFFSSEVRPLLVAGAPRDANHRLVKDFLDHGLMEGPGGDTFFAHVRELPGGHFLRWHAGRLNVSRYYRLPEVNRSPQISIAHRVEEAVSLHQIADVPLGSCLSGGVDSSVLVSIIREQRGGGERQYVLTAGCEDPGIDETPYARGVATHLGLSAKEILPTVDGLLDDLPALVRHQEQPFSTTGVYMQWCLMRAASQWGLKVMLDGQGADEVFGGYFHHLLAWCGDLAARGKVRAAWALLRSWSASGPYQRLAMLGFSVLRMHPASLETLYRGETIGTLTSRGVRGKEHRYEQDLRLKSRFQQARLSDILWRTLPGILRYEDRNSMAFGVEARVPYLDHPLVEEVLAQGGQTMFAGGISKAPLRDLLVKYESPTATRTDKLGFATPDRPWFERKLGDFAEEVFTDRQCRESGLLDSKAALRQLTRARLGGATSGVWRALSVALWEAWVVSDPTRKHRREVAI